MRRVIPVALVVLVAAGALVLLLRGGDDDGCGDGYPSTPECLAEEFVTREDASKCDFVDQEVLEEVMKARGPAARERCARTVAAGPAPDEVQILEEEGEEEGDEEGGTVEVEFLADGKEGAIVVRKEGGRWRIVEFGEG
ncbi:MAG TPA: hypothetical protein VF529_11600 [Solirubrobacteraceae bacterium]|jgi:hypothetical protein